ncbi:MAG TPA: helicase-associated domain-containing protein [Leifsonia sp.]
MTNTLALAARLRALPDADLLSALAARSYRRAGIADFFDLADALLERDSVQRALTALDRTALAVLVVLGRASGPLTAHGVSDALSAAPGAPGVDARVAAGVLGELERLLLVYGGDDGFAPYQAVTDQLEAWPSLGLASADALLGDAPPPSLAPVPDTERRFTDRLGSERAFEAAAGVSELLSELSREGARELQKGGLALPATKRVAAALSIDVEAVPTVVSVAARAGLIDIDDGLWLPSASAAEWLHSTTAERWRALAAAWQDALPDELRRILAGRSRAAWGESLRDYVAWLHPGDQAAAEQRVDDFMRDAEWLGITANQAPSSAGSALVEHGADAAARIVQEQFPSEVDKVYLQHDLTAVAPGPLQPEIDARLRVVADVESRALASTFRMSASTIDRAITAGETADSIRSFLAGISLTGVPQPLEYLIADAAEKHGRVRVREVSGRDLRDGHDGRDGRGGMRSAVVSEDHTLLTTIAVDQALGSLGLVRAGDALESPFDRDVVFWALSDARYPVAAEDADGTVVALRRRRTARPKSPDAPDPAAELIARLREAEEAAAESTGEQWMTRQLELAIRGRLTLAVEVAMPDGQRVEYLLEPTGVGGGRLRGRDRAADIERTLPLSSVTGVRPVEE